MSATGGVNIITKRGSNDFHGGAFAFGCGFNMAARTGLGPVQPDFDREQYGVQGGGPIIKDRLFVFGSFEKTHESSAISVSTPYFLAISSWAGPYDEMSSNIRADYKLPKSKDLFFRWNRNDNNSLGGVGGNRLPSTGNFNHNIAHQFVGGLIQHSRPVSPIHCALP